MHGAIAGDFIGSRYEHNNIKSKRFPLFGDACRFTDDTVMTAAVADALLKACETGAIADENRTKRMLVSSMHMWGNKYPYAGYGMTFFSWLKKNNRESDILKAIDDPQYLAKLFDDFSETKKLNNLSIDTSQL